MKNYGTAWQLRQDNQPSLWRTWQMRLRKRYTPLPTLFCGLIWLLLSSQNQAEMLTATRPDIITSTDLTARALLTATQQTILSSQIAGKISHLNVREGDWFKKEDPLVRLDCGIQQAQKEKAAVILRKTHHQLEVQKQLDALNSGSLLDLKLAAANVDQAKAELSMVDINLQYCTIKAPFSGQVVERNVSAYQNISVGQPLLEIVDNRSLQIKLIIPSSWLSWINTGQSFGLNLDETNDSYLATVTRLGAKIDPASQSVTIFGKIQGSHPRLISGMSGFANFDMPERLSSLSSAKE